MTEVVDFTKRLQEKQEDQQLTKYYDNHDVVLDVCDEVFPEGAVILALCDKELQVSSNIEDTETVVGMLTAVLTTLIEQKE